MSIPRSWPTAAFAAGFFILVAGHVSAQTLDLKVPLDGPSIYKAYCAACHGADGTGKGPAAGSFKYPPPDLTTIAKNNKGEFPVLTIEDVIQNGAKWKSHGSGSMPTWGPIFKSVDKNDLIAQAHLHNLITYLESIQVK